MSATDLDGLLPVDRDTPPEDVVGAVRAWIDDHVPAPWREQAQRGRPIREVRTRAEYEAWYPVFGASGLVAPTWPRAYGGLELSPGTARMVDAELRPLSLGRLNPLGLNLAAPALFAHGSEEQRRRYLPPIVRNEEVWCQLFSEPGAGSDLASLSTHAERDGDGWVLSGQKVWNTWAHLAGWAVVLARTDPDVPKRQGITYFLLDMHQPGVEVRPLRQLTGSAHFSEVFMTDARAEKADLIGRLGQGWEIAQTTLSYERGGNSLARVTRYTAAFGQLVRAARALRRDGRPLLDDPRVRARLGGIYAELEVQRYAALRVLSALEKGEGPGPASSITKLSYSEFEKRYQEVALEILGPWGQLTDLLPHDFLEIDTSSGEAGSWAHAFLWSRAGTIYAGSSEIQKNVIADRVLQLPKEPRADRGPGR